MQICGRRRVKSCRVIRAKPGRAELPSASMGGLLCLANCVFNMQAGWGGARPQLEQCATNLVLGLKHAVPTAQSALLK